MKEEVTNTTAGIEGKKEPLNKKNMAKRKPKGDCPMKGKNIKEDKEYSFKDPKMKGRTFKMRTESYKKSMNAGQDWNGQGAVYVVGKLIKSKKAGKTTTPKRDKGKPSKEGQDVKGNGNVKEFYISPEGYVLMSEAGVLKAKMMHVKGKLKKVRVHVKAHKGAKDVQRSGALKTASSRMKNIRAKGGFAKMKKLGKTLKRTLKKRKATRKIKRAKAFKLNINKHVK
jgi:hypothetical protein